MSEKIYNYPFEPIDSRMYILIENRSALIIDPNQNPDGLRLLRDAGVTNLLIILTHEHYDHIIGVNDLRNMFPNVTVLCSKKCADYLPLPSKNLSNFWQILFMNLQEKSSVPIDKLGLGPYRCTSDKDFENELSLDWHGHKLYLKETPGHSPGSICIILDDKSLFSGDSLVTGYDTITRLPGGSKKLFETETLSWLQTLSPDITVYPGHGDSQSLSKYHLF